MNSTAPENDEKQGKSVRTPVQSRSMNTKEKILNAAFDLFCRKGYYQTTTNEIAQCAHVSIGSLYAYFKDKDTIFLEVLDKYHEKFATAKNEILDNHELLHNSPKAWLKALVENLIRVHEETKELNRELHVLSFYDPKIADILERNKKNTMQAAAIYFTELQNTLPLDDVDSVAAVIFDMISATVDRIVFGKNEISRERLVTAVVDIVSRYLGV